MIERCKSGNQYGLIGITVCPEWRTFAAFLSDMGERPEGHELDREDPLGHYTKANCRWLQMRPNRQYRRTTKLDEGKRAEARRLRSGGWTYQQIADALGVSKSCIGGYFRQEAWRPTTAEIPRPPSILVGPQT